jgi:hypothetical protein
MTRLTIDIEVDNYLFDLEEGHMETTFTVYRSLIPELQKTGDVKSCRILISAYTKKESHPWPIPGATTPDKS